MNKIKRMNKNSKLNKLKLMIRMMVEASKPFTVVDTYGTRVQHLTLAGARKWLPYCSGVAVIGQHRKVIEFRAIVVK